MVLWDEVFQAVRGDYPDVQASSLLVDAAAMDFVRKPETFDVVVASNLFGDILTDLSAVITVGSMGLAASANINPERTHPSLFEPVPRLGARHRRQGHRQSVGRRAVGGADAGSSWPGKGGGGGAAPWRRFSRPGGRSLPISAATRKRLR